MNSSFISSQLTDLDEDGHEFNFLVKELENLRWEEVKTDLGIEQKPVWGKQPKHAIDAVSYVVATINKPKRPAVAQATTGLVKPFFHNSESDPPHYRHLLENKRVINRREKLCTVFMRKRCGKHPE